jgi:hypothetical protein
MNQFPYFTEIEDEFVRLRGKHLLISPLDWSLIETWQQQGIPLRVALRGINAAFDKFKGQPGKARKVNSLFYCQQAVEAAFEEHQAAQIGGQNGSQAEAHAPQPLLPESITEAIYNWQEQIAELRDDSMHDDLLYSAFDAPAAALHDLYWHLSEVLDAGLEKLDAELSAIESLMLDQLKRHAGEEFLAQCRAEAEQQMQRYKVMDAEAYRQTLENAVAKRLREHYRVPRLGLFYL